MIIYSNLVEYDISNILIHEYVKILLRILILYVYFNKHISKSTYIISIDPNFT